MVINFDSIDKFEKENQKILKKQKFNFFQWSSYKKREKKRKINKNELISSNSYNK